MNSDKSFLKSGPFESRQPIRRDLRRSWTSDATSIQSVPPQFSVSKMSNAILNDATLVWVAPPILNDATLVWVTPPILVWLISLSFTTFL
jgi:hypothetical protein